MNINLVAAGQASLWESDPVAGLLIVASVLLWIICLPRLMTLSHYLFGGLVQWKITARLARSVSLSRDRNYLCLASILPTCLVSARYGIYHIAPMNGQPVWIVVLMTAGALLAYLLMRLFLVKTFLPKNMADAWKISRTNLPNGVIIIAIVTSATAILMHLCKAPDELAKNVILYESALIFLVILYRNYEILSWKGQRFKAFLYLCGLELIPALALIISAILF